MNYSDAKYSEVSIQESQFIFENPDGEDYYIVVNNSNDHDVTFNCDTILITDSELTYYSKAKYVQEDILQTDINYTIPDDQSYYLAIVNFNNVTATVDYEYSNVYRASVDDGQNTSAEEKQNICFTGLCILGIIVIVVIILLVYFLWLRKKK